MKFKPGDLIIGSAYVSRFKPTRLAKIDSKRKFSFWLGYVLETPNPENNDFYQIFWMYVFDNSKLQRMEYESYRKGYTEETYVLVPDDFLSREKTEYAE